MCDFGWFRTVCAHFAHRTAPVSIENRAIFREIRRDFGAEDACIDRKTCATTAGIRRACSGEDLQQNFECAVRCARKTCKIFDENRTILCWFLQVFGAQHVRCECASLLEMHDGRWR